MKLEVNHKKNLERPRYMEVKEHSTKEWVNQEIKEEIKKHVEVNENENMTVQNLWDTAKVVIRGSIQQ